MPQNRTGFITAGTWCVDYNMKVACWPAEETSNRILSGEVSGGGSGCNFAVDIRRLAPEIPVEGIGYCGDDPDGRLLFEIAREHGIGTARFTVDPVLRTHRTLAFTSLENGKRTHLFEAVSSDGMTPDHFDFTGCTAWMLHLGLPGTHKFLDAPWQGDPNGWVTVLKKARAQGLKTNMEVMSIPRDDLRRIMLPCLEYLDYLVVNDYEIGALADLPTLRDGVTSLPDVIAAARKALDLGTIGLVVVHFPGGAIAIERGGAVHTHPSVDVPANEIAGSNGAGDAFAAGFFCGLHRGKVLADCLAHAHAAAATSLRQVATYGAMETMEACLERAAQHGWHENLPMATAQA
ncbi:MAG: carbohydrate kinase family protein [Pseudorhodobacter sp.]